MAIYGKFKVKMLDEIEGDKFTVRKFEMGEDSPYMAPVSVCSLGVSFYLVRSFIRTQGREGEDSDKDIELSNDHVITL